MGQANEGRREGKDEGTGQMPPPQSPPHLSLPPQAHSADAAAVGVAVAGDADDAGDAAELEISRKSVANADVVVYVSDLNVELCSCLFTGSRLSALRQIM